MLHSFEKIFDISQMRELTQRFSDLMGISSAIIGVDGTIWVKCNWQDICELFHRKHPVTHQRCLDSDIRVAAKHLKDNDIVIYRCKNGLMEAATPIKIKGEHIANLYMGQFLQEPPDIAYFMQNARDFGFDETAYIQALLQVPVFAEDKIKAIAAYFSKLAIVIGEMGLSQIRLHQSNELLRESEQRYRLLVENDAGATMVVQKDTIMFANQSLLDTIGVNRNILLLIHPEDRPQLKTFLNKVLRGTTHETLSNIRTIIEPKLTKWAQIKAVVMDWQGQQALLVHMYDITAQKEAEKAIRKAQQEIATAQKMEAVANLATGVAHDFNNFAQIIGTNVELLLATEGKDNPTYNKLKEIELAVIKTSELTQRLLMFRDDQPSCRQPVDLNVLIEQVAHSLKPLLPPTIEITLDLKSDLRVKNGDSVKLFQIFMNLLLNAKDAMPNGGRVSIDTRNFVVTPKYVTQHPYLEPGQYICSRVLDEGPGLTNEDLLHLFEPFYTSKQPGQGTGLGLTTAYNFAKNHAGHITCQNAGGKGALFTVILPATQVVTKPIRFPVGGFETILLVDDDPYILNRGKEYLHSYGYTVLEALSGEEAIETFCNNRDTIKLVIMDLIMPGMGGEKCIEEILRIDPEINILVASAYLTDNFINNRAIKERIKGFVAKPYIKGRLLHAIRKAIDPNLRELGAINPCSKPSSRQKNLPLD